MSSQSTPKDPRSPIDISSGSTSPHVLRPTPASTLHTKQRSSSINSVGSTQSTQHRSMSIVSLGSPRNSIISVDDFLLRPTRNNSTASLALLGPAASPDVLRDSPAGRVFKSKPKSTSAILSDEEFSESEHTFLRLGSQRRRSSDKKQKPTFLSNFKKNFRFKHDSKPADPLRPRAPSLSTKFDDNTPSPLSLANETGLFLDDDAHRSAPKKLRSSSITQSILLKKRILLSKDIQMELLSNHPPGQTFPSSSSDTKYPFPPHVPPPGSPNRGLIHNFLSVHDLDGPAPGTHVAPQLRSVSPPLSVTSPRPPSPLQSSMSSVPYNEQTAQQQNKLIHELNRKWNKSMYAPTHVDFLLPADALLDTDIRGHLPRKRARSDLASSTSSLTTHP